MTTVRSPRNSLSKRGYYSNLSVILDTPLLFLAKSIVLTDHGENNAPIEGAFSTPEISNPVAAVTSVNRKAKHQLRCERKEVRISILLSDCLSGILDIVRLHVRD